MKDHSTERYISEILDTGVLDAIGDGISIQGTDFKILYQNSRHKLFIGDHVGKYCYRAYEERSHICSGCPLVMSFKDGLSHTEERTIKRDKGISHFEITASPLRDKTGKIIAGIEVVRDITERKQDKEDVEKIFDMTNYLVCVAGLDGFFQKVSFSFEETLGYSSAELLSKPFIEFIHPDDREKTKAVIEEKINYGSEVIGFENRYLCKDGYYKWLSWSAKPVVDEGKMYAIAYDVTERRKAEDLSRFLGSITEQVSDSVIATDLNQKIIYVNQSFEKLYGYSKEELLGQPPHILNAEPDLEQRQNEIYKAVSSGGVWKGELRNRKKNGSEFICELTVFPLFDQKGDIFSFASVQRDVTQRRKTEEELLKVQKLESIGILAGGIAHDFNNLLTAILNNLFLMRMHSKTDTKVQERIDVAEKAIKKAQELTNQLLTFSRGGAPVKALTDLGDLIKESAELALSGSNSRCEFSISDDLWNVQADAGQINQVFQNIIINADQSMPQGGIISIGCENLVVDNDGDVSLKKGDYVKVTIRDMGIGISEDHLLKIFDPFFSTKEKGSGLGLSTAFSIVKKHNGLIDVQSATGDGTIITIYLPATSKKTRSNTFGNNLPLRGEGNILIMDDDVSVQESLGQLLNSIGYTTECASDGKEAISLYENALASNSPFDALIIDLTIPGGMGGKETIKELIKINPNVKAIVSSGYSYDPIMANYRKHGFSGVLKKPFRDIRELNKILNKVIRDGSQEHCNK